MSHLKINHLTWIRTIAITIINHALIKDPLIEIEFNKKCRANRGIRFRSIHLLSKATFWIGTSILQIKGLMNQTLQGSRGSTHLNS